MKQLEIVHKGNKNRKDETKIIFWIKSRKKSWIRSQSRCPKAERSLGAASACDSPADIAESNCALCPSRKEQRTLAPQPSSAMRP